MKSSTKILLGAVGAAGILASSLAVQHTFAATTSSGTGPFAGLAAAIASKFNLDQASVQSTISDFQTTQRATHEAEQAKSLADRLTAAVTSGELTSAQKDLITAKVAELKTQRDANANLSETDRHTAMEKTMTDLKQWATDNKIDMKWLRPMGGPGGPGGHHGMMGDGAPPGDGPNTTPAS